MLDIESKGITARVKNFTFEIVGVLKKSRRRLRRARKGGEESEWLDRHARGLRRINHFGFLLSRERSLPAI